MEQLLISVSTITRCDSASVFILLVGSPAGFVSSAVGLKICAITSIIKKYKLIIRKNRKIIK